MRSRRPTPFKVQFESSFRTAAAGMGLEVDLLAAVWRGIAVYFDPSAVSQRGRISLDDRLIDDLGWDPEDIEFALEACLHTCGCRQWRVRIIDPPLPHTLREFLNLLASWRKAGAWT